MFSLTCEDSNPTMNNILLCLLVPRTWTSSFQIKSSMTFIRGNKYIESEKDNFKNGGEVNRLMECALALSTVSLYFSIVIDRYKCLLVV